MQYALMELNDRRFIFDSHEHVLLFGGGLDSFLFKEPPASDDNIPLKLVYGVYMPQPDLSKSQIRQDIRMAVNKWLVCVHGGACNYCGIEDIELLDVTIMSQCGHCPKPHATSNVAFAALMKIPSEIVLGNGKTQARSVFVKYNNLDIPTNILNRKGLFALVCEEKRVRTELSIENWRGFIDYKRAVRYAQRIK